MGVEKVKGESRFGRPPHLRGSRSGTQGSLARSLATLGCGTYPFQG